ncbi:MAG TPA: hypothetical protein ENG95_03005, partial [Nitrospirae bacterium]|nr:hypothetical protein [Nitrospirota bacterium]
MSKNKNKILTTITLLESRLQEIDIERGNIVNEINKLKKTLSKIVDSQPGQSTHLPSLTARPLSNEKIALFRSLFRGREDVFPKLWVSKKTRKTGYSPVCENEWIRGVCNKGSIKCGECENRKFSLLTNEIIRKHLDGEVIIGVYPLMKDETCWFLAVDFDGQSWQDDVLAFFSICKKNNVP